VKDGPTLTWSHIDPGKPESIVSHEYHYPEQAGPYRQRWDLVRDAEAVELQRTPMALKLRQLEALMASRNEFVDDPERAQEIESVLERCAGLRKALGT
jgi:hypothetical protein